MTGDDNARGTKRSARDAPSNEQQTKRTRVTRACDQCRATRERCDGNRPVCGTCTTQNRACAWNEPPKKRGIQPNYIRSLELTLAWLFRRFPGCEEQLAECLPDADGLAHKLIGSKDAVGAETLHQSWRNSVVSKQLEQVLSGSPVDRISVKDSTKAPVALEPNEPLQLPMSIAAADTSTSPSAEHEKSAHKQTEKTELPSNAWTLIEYYTAYTHSWLPFIGQHDILKAMYSFPSNQARAGDETSADYCNLFGVLAIAATQMHQAQGGERPAKLQEDARRLLSQQRDKSSSISCFLLHAILDLIENRTLSAWLHLGTVQRLLLYPHPINKASSSPLWDRWRRVKIAAALIENALATRLSIAAQHCLGDADQSYLASEEGDEEWAPWKDPLEGSSPTLQKSPIKSCSTFNRLARVLLSSCKSEDASVTILTKRTSEMVLHLVTNACKPAGRKQPAAVVIELEKAGLLSNPAEANELGGGHRIIPNQYDGPGAVEPLQQPDLFDSIPLPSNPGLQGGEDVWQPQAGLNGLGALPQSDGTLCSAQDTGFDEFASYDNISCSYPDDEFLRNLGFRPELDLTEFMGADHQASDPLMAMLQPDLLTAGGDGIQPGAT